MTSLLFLIFGYLCGSIPFSYLMAKFLGGKDVRREGSGNVGATNVLRVAGKKAGAAAAAGDIIKSILPVAAARLYGLDPLWIALTAAAAIAGHCYPVWLRFSGGKGVNSTVAVFTVLFWPAGLVFAAVWLALFFSTGFVSLASMVASLTVPAALYFGDAEKVYVLFGAATAIFIVYRHRSNVKRLLDGTESRMKGGKKGASKG